MGRGLIDGVDVSVVIVVDNHGCSAKVKPVKKPNSMLSQLRPANWVLARTAPTSTAKPIIMQLTGRINLMKPPSLFMLSNHLTVKSLFNMRIKAYTIASNVWVVFGYF